MAFHSGTAKGAPSLNIKHNKIFVTKANIYKLQIVWQRHKWYRKKKSNYFVNVLFSRLQHDNEKSEIERERDRKRADHICSHSSHCFLTGHRKPENMKTMIIAQY